MKTGARAPRCCCSTAWGPPAFPGAIIWRPWGGTSGSWPRTCRPTGAPPRRLTLITISRPWPPRSWIFWIARGSPGRRWRATPWGAVWPCCWPGTIRSASPALALLAPAAALTRVPWIFYPLRLPWLGPLAAVLLGPWIIPLALRLAYHRWELITPEVVAGYALPFRDRRRRLALASLCRQLQIGPLSQVEALLQEIRQPVALIWGAKDRILPVNQAYWMKARLPQAEFHLLPEVGHAPQEEAPAAVNKIIIAFLTRSLKN